VARKSLVQRADVERLKQLRAVASAFDGFRPAREVLTEVRAVPTRFVQLDHATRVGGWPLERFNLVHGPSNQGKTVASLGLEDSFLALDHFALHLDAERTTPGPWLVELMGKMSEHPYFFAERPDTYEQAIGKVREFLNKVASLKAKGKVPKDTGAIVVCDSLRKLVPENLMKEIIQADKEEGEGKKITAGRDRRAQLQAKMNAAWMDELTPLLEHSCASFVAIGREMEDPDANPFLKKFGLNFKVGGGGAIVYDSSLVCRIERDDWVTCGSGPDREIYGERHRVTIRKTKIGGKDDKVTRCYFHTSNGKLIAPGFDRARDVLDLGEKFGLITKKGAVRTRGGNTKGGLTWGKLSWRTVHDAVRALSEDAGLLRGVEQDVRASFERHAPVAFDAETGEVT
jgi:hypothetical protein